MDELKLMEEQRDNLLKEMQKANEERNFEMFDEKENELRELENKIKIFKLSNKTGFEKTNEDDVKKTDMRKLVSEVISTRDEINISDYELRDSEIVIGSASGSQKSLGNIAKTTFANYIIKKASEVSPLFESCRIEILPGKTHVIPVQKTKLGKFVKTSEVAAYIKQTAEFEPIKLESVKYTNLVVLSEEVLEDTGYDIESEMREQILESYGETLDHLIVVGDSSSKVEGLNMLSDSSGAKKVVQDSSGVITIDELMKMYFSIKYSYRKNAKWVFSTEVAEKLANLKDDMGRPLLTPSYNNAPFGEGSTLLGKPVIINDNVSTMSSSSKSIFFGDLKKAIIVGPRRNLTLKKSEEIGFLNDSIALKASVRLDIKIALQEAICYYECV